ncbi:MAG: SPFH domain-containing protein [Rhizomicrobium sp.]
MTHVNRFMLGVVILAGIVILSTLFGTYYTVDQGERGVLLRWGQAVDVVGPGLHFKWPFIESVVTMSVREQKEDFKTQAYSQDQQPATVEVSVNYKLPDDPRRVSEVYTRYGTGYPSILIDTQLPQRLKKCSAPSPPRT